MRLKQKEKAEIGLALLVMSALILVLSLTSCKKETKEPEIKQDHPALRCYEISKAIGIVWHPIYNGYTAPQLNSDSTYYENGTYLGRWVFDGCNKITVSNPTVAANNFFFGISKLTTDTLQVETARFGVKLFYK